MNRKIPNQRYSQAGVSLVELMVGLTVGLIITAVAFMALFSNQKLIFDKDSADRSQENLRFATTTITRLVRQATSFGFPENNNELIVYFDSSQRDCLGEKNNSSVNTFKLNTENELVCELVLNDGSTKIVPLAKNITELKFAYGVQTGVQATPLEYKSYVGDAGVLNTAVENVWGTITSVLTQIAIDDGGSKQPTVNFVATSHLRAISQLASTGGSSLVNPSINTGENNGDGNGNGNGDGDGDGNNESTDTIQCTSAMLNLINVSGTGFNSTKWGSMLDPTYATKGTNVTVTVNTGVDITGWKIQKDSSDFNALKSTESFKLDNGNGKKMMLTVKCGENFLNDINFITTQ